MKEPTLKEPTLKEPTLKEPTLKETTLKEPTLKEPTLKETTLKVGRPKAYAKENNHYFPDVCKHFLREVFQRDLLLRVLFR